MLRQVSPDLPDVVEGESIRPGDRGNVGCEGELVIPFTTYNYLSVKYFTV